MIRSLVALLSVLALAACAVPAGPPLVSAQYPPNVSRNSEPQSPTSLPPGAGNIAPGPNGASPNYLSFQIGNR